MEKKFGKKAILVLKIEKKLMDGNNEFLKNFSIVSMQRLISLHATSAFN